MKIDGGCHCGYITYEGEADPGTATICHCADCQMLSGTAFRTALPVPSEKFRIVTGEPTIYVKTAESGNKRQQAFCPRCGSPIYSTTPGEGPKQAYMVRVGVLRERDQLTPKVQNWTRSARPWVFTTLGALRANEKGAPRG